MNRLLEIDKRHASDDQSLYEQRHTDPLWVSRINGRRIEDCNKLLGGIKGGMASALNDAELQYLCRQIENAGADTPPHGALVLTWWQLAHTAPVSSRIHDLAKTTLANPKARWRGMAFKYLQNSYPDDAAALFVKLEKDQDPELLYALAVYIRDRDPIKSTHLCIDAFMLPLRIHDLPESLAMQITSTGTREHAARLRRLAKECPSKRGILKSLAELIERRHWF